ncbi:helix-turn-helix domain-containing protein [Catelliglobosispora koreensis]|uniref:helix-turn-helix domain-containing protein n=1 Tax=Catelliglobosispora koreensis TaxID=129052 RepID=UPI00036F1C36|nr:helix-turn-helix domain-containing protein [Catelliglobosispora koreensis]
MKRAGVPDWTAASWHGRPLWQILADRDIGTLFQFLSAHGYSRSMIAGQTGLGEHRVSAIAKGRQRVEAYAVLERICEGLCIPRDLMGLGQSAPSADPPWAVAVCGSRQPGTDEQVIDNAVVALATLFREGTCAVRHGPRGIGIEVVTYIGNHFRPVHLRQAVGIFGHANVVRDVAAAIIVGGGQGTHDEVDAAVRDGIPLIPVAASGGAAARAYTLMQADPQARRGIDTTALQALRTCCEAASIATAVGHAVGQHVPAVKPMLNYPGDGVAAKSGPARSASVAKGYEASW